MRGLHSKHFNYYTDLPQSPQRSWPSFAVLVSMLNFQGARWNNLHFWPSEVNSSLISRQPSKQEINQRKTKQQPDPGKNQQEKNLTSMQSTWTLDTLCFENSAPVPRCAEHAPEAMEIRPCYFTKQDLSIPAPRYQWIVKINEAPNHYTWTN